MKINFEKLLSTSPERILHRDEQINQLKKFVFNAPDLGYKPDHVFIFGDTGTGKTLVVQNLADEMNSKYNNCIYINFEKYKNENEALEAIYHRICEKLIIPPRDLPYSKYIDEILNLLAINKKYYVLIFDEIDHVIKKPNDDSFLYPFLRPQECTHSDKIILSPEHVAKISLVCLSNNIYIRDLLSKKIQSSFGHIWIEFKQYTKNQLRDILEDRLKQSVSGYPPSDNSAKERWTKVIEAVLNYSAPLGDARFALELIATAFKNCSDKEITEDDVHWAKEFLDKAELQKHMQSKDDNALLLLYSTVELIPVGRAYLKHICELYETLCYFLGTKPVSYETRTRMMGSWENVGILHSTVLSERGSPLNYQIKYYPIDFVKQCLMEEFSKREIKKLSLYADDIREKINNISKSKQMVLEAE